MKDAECWNLISGGPSRVHLRREHLLDGPVVTVNRAMDVVERGIPVDFAAFSDGPDRLWIGQDMFRLWKPGIVLWVPSACLVKKVKTKDGREGIVPGDPYAKLWDRALPASVGFRLMPHGSLKDERMGAMRGAFTTFCAFMGILRYQPKEVRILSMDMAGPWHDGMTAEGCEAYDLQRENFSRWEHERLHMTRAMNQARGEGIRVESIVPEPLIVAA